MYTPQPNNFTPKDRMEQFVFDDIRKRRIAGGVDSVTADNVAKDGLSIFKTHRYTGPFYKVADKLVKDAKRLFKD